MKIHIIGCSGSGKTYLAKKLSEKYNIPRFDLDDIQWDNTTQNKNLKEIKNILENYEGKVVLLSNKRDVSRIID